MRSEWPSLLHEITQRQPLNITVMKREITTTMLCLLFVGTIMAQDVKRPESFNYLRGVEAANQDKFGDALEYFEKDIQENPQVVN